MDQDLINFLQKEIGNKDYFPEMKLYKDLNLYGEEAHEFLVHFSDKFYVDISNFKFNQHFPPETDKITLFLLSVFTKKTYLDLTLHDLENAIRKKRLE